MNNKETVKDGYNTVAVKYLASRTKDSEDVQLLQELVQRLPPGAKILDAGCGAGVPITKSLSETFVVTGVDFAEEQLHLACRLVPTAEFVCQDITQLSFPDNSFNAICSYYAIIHIPREEHRAVFQSFYRLLQPLGLALLCLGATDLANDFTDDYLGTKMFWSHYDAETNLRLLKECGFDVIWSKLVMDQSSPGSAHLFVLAEKGTPNTGST